jgi:hypothetical protein
MIYQTIHSRTNIYQIYPQTSQVRMLHYFPNFDYRVLSGAGLGAT